MRTNIFSDILEKYSDSYLNCLLHFPDNGPNQGCRFQLLCVSLKMLFFVSFNLMRYIVSHAYAAWRLMLLSRR